MKNTISKICAMFLIVSMVLATIGTVTFAINPETVTVYADNTMIELTFDDLTGIEQSSVLSAITLKNIATDDIIALTGAVIDGNRALITPAEELESGVVYGVSVDTSFGLTSTFTEMFKISELVNTDKTGWKISITPTTNPLYDENADFTQMRTSTSSASPLYIDITNNILYIHADKDNGVVVNERTGLWDLERYSVEFDIRRYGKPYRQFDIHYNVQTEDGKNTNLVTGTENYLRYQGNSIGWSLIGWANAQAGCFPYADNAGTNVTRSIFAGGWAWKNPTASWTYGTHTKAAAPIPVPNLYVQSNMYSIDVTMGTGSDWDASDPFTETITGVSPTDAFTTLKISKNGTDADLFEKTVSDLVLRDTMNKEKALANGFAESDWRTSTKGAFALEFQGSYNAAKEDKYSPVALRSVRITKYEKVEPYVVENIAADEKQVIITFKNDMTDASKAVVAENIEIYHNSVAPENKVAVLIDEITISGNTIVITKKNYAEKLIANDNYIINIKKNLLNSMEDYQQSTVVSQVERLVIRQIENGDKDVTVIFENDMSPYNNSDIFKGVQVEKDGIIQSYQQSNVTVNGNVVNIVMDNNFILGATYTLILKKEFSYAAEDAKYDFDIAALKIEEIYADTGIVEIDFNADLTPIATKQDAEENIFVADADGKAIKGEFVIKKDVVEFNPTEKINVNTSYYLTIDKAFADVGKTIYKEIKVVPVIDTTKEEYNPFAKDFKKFGWWGRESTKQSFDSTTHTFYFGLETKAVVGAYTQNLRKYKRYTVDFKSKYYTDSKATVNAPIGYYINMTDAFPFYEQERVDYVQNPPYSVLVDGKLAMGWSTVYNVDGSASDIKENIVSPQYKGEGMSVLIEGNSVAQTSAQVTGWKYENDAITGDDNTPFKEYTIRKNMAEGKFYENQILKSTINKEHETLKNAKMLVKTADNCVVGKTDTGFDLTNAINKNVSVWDNTIKAYEYQWSGEKMATVPITTTGGLEYGEFAIGAPTVKTHGDIGETISVLAIRDLVVTIPEVKDVSFDVVKLISNNETISESGLSGTAIIANCNQFSDKFAKAYIAAYKDGAIVNITPIDTTDNKYSAGQIIKVNYGPFDADSTAVIVIDSNTVEKCNGTVITSMAVSDLTTGKIEVSGTVKKHAEKRNVIIFIKKGEADKYILTVPVPEDAESFNATINYKDDISTEAYMLDIAIPSFIGNEGLKFYDAYDYWYANNAQVNSYLASPDEKYESILKYAQSLGVDISRAKTESDDFKEIIEVYAKEFMNVSMTKEEANDVIKTAFARASLINDIKDEALTVDRVNGVLMQYEETAKLDLTAYKALGDAKTKVCNKFIKADYEAKGYAQFVNDFNSAVIEAKTPVGSGVVGGGGGAGAVTPISGGVGGGGYIEEEEKPSATIIDNDDLFTDIEDFEWAKNAISNLSKRGIIAGIGDGKFNPSGNVTREQMVKMLVVAFDLFDSSAEVDFDDVSKSDWSYKYIASAKKAGLVNGISEKEFGLGKEITREDAAVMLYRAAVSTGREFTNKEADFADYSLISEYAKEAVEYMSGAKVINGFEDKTFRPQALANRAQAAMLVYALTGGNK